MKHIPRKRFGQNFLVDESVIYRIISLLGVFKSGDHVVEIGPGRGALTFPLLESIKQSNKNLAKPCHLSAIEIDRDLIDFLNLKTQKEQMAGVFKIYSTDVLKFDFQQLISPIRIIGNLPYNVTTPLLFYLLQFKSSIKDMVFMLQKEVVERITATKNTKNYGRLSVMLQSEFDCAHCFNVGNQSFNPPPQVESALIRLTPIENVFAHKEEFKKIVQVFFSHRRKTIKNLLGMLKLDPEKIEKCANMVDLARRPENLSVKEYKQLAAIVSSV